MSDGYTPTTRQVRTFWASDGKLQPAAKSYKFAESAAEFDRWLAAHDQALREQIAREYGIGNLTSRPLYDAQTRIRDLEGTIRALRHENRRLENALEQEQEQ